MRESDGLRRIRTGERFRRAIRLALEAPKSAEESEHVGRTLRIPIVDGKISAEDIAEQIRATNADETPEFPELKAAGADTPDKVAKLLALGLSDAETAGSVVENPDSDAERFLR